MKNLEAKQEETDVVDAILKECVSSYFRDDSWRDPKLSEAKIALQTWIREGLPPNNGKLYLDPVLNNEYSQMELKPIADNNIIMERLVEAPTINRFRCCLHKLIVDVVGVNNLVGIREKDIPGTSDFHIQHRVLLEAE